MRSHHRILLCLCIFSIVYSLFFINQYAFPILGDGHHYFAYGANLYKGNGYTCQEFPPFSPSNLREPAYPFFIYGLFQIFGISKNAIYISQAILNGIIVLITYSLANLILNNKKEALTAAFLTAVSPAIAGYAGLVASETLATVFLMLLFLFFLMFLKEKRRTRAIGLSILVGFFCGCLALTKMTYFLLPALICLILFITPLDKFIKHKAVLCIAIIFTSILLPWLSFNSRIYGNPFFLTNRSGIAMAIKAERLNWTAKETSLSFIYSFSESLLKRYFPGEYKKISAIYVEKIALDKYASFIKRGYGEMAADKQLRVDALNKIRGDIFKYAILSVSDFHYMLYFEGVPFSQFTDFLRRQTRGAINLFFKIYSLIIVFFSVKGAFIMLRNRENYFLKIAFLLPIFYTFFMYSAIFGIPRFTFPVIPCIYILASVSISKMVKIRMPL